MLRRPLSRPTETELEILYVLYGRGSGTARDIYEAIPKELQTLYTSILKMMQMKVEKDLVKAVINGY